MNNSPSNLSEITQSFPHILSLKSELLLRKEALDLNLGIDSVQTIDDTRVIITVSGLTSSGRQLSASYMLKTYELTQGTVYVQNLDHTDKKYAVNFDSEQVVSQIVVDLYGYQIPGIFEIRRKANRVLRVIEDADPEMIH